MLDTAVPFGQAGAQRVAAIQEDQEQEDAERHDYYVVQAARREDQQANLTQSSRGRTGNMNAQSLRNDTPQDEGDSPNFQDYMVNAAVQLAEYKNISEYTTNERDKKHNSACKHFDFYLAKHRKIPWTHATIPYEHINDDVIGGYLSKFTRYKLVVEMLVRLSQLHPASGLDFYSNELDDMATRAVSIAKEHLSVPPTSDLTITTLQKKMKETVTDPRFRFPSSVPLDSPLRDAGRKRSYDQISNTPISRHHMENV